MVRRIALACMTVGLLLLTTAAPAFAAQPFKESGTQNYFFSVASDCDEGGSRTTCTDTVLDVWPSSPDTVEVCLSRYTYTFNDRTGRGRLVSEESGCQSNAADALSVTVSGGILTATLSETDVTFFSCNQRRCTEGDTVTVSATDSGPAVAYSGRGSFRDGSCSFRYSFTGYRAEVTGTMTVDGQTLEQDFGSASTEEYRVMERCR